MNILCGPLYRPRGSYLARGSTAIPLGMEWLLVRSSSALRRVGMSITSILAQRESIQYSLLLTQSTAMSSTSATEREEREGERDKERERHQGVAEDPLIFMSA